MDFSDRSLPLIRSLLDTDLYKLLMLQMIWRLHRDVPVTFSLVNRTRRVRLAEEADPGALRAELDHVRSLTLSAEERAWLAGASIYGRTDRFAPDFLDWLGALRLPPYALAVEDGQLRLEFHGPWAETTLWEIPALMAVSGLRARRAVEALDAQGREAFYACGRDRLAGKVARLRRLEGVSLSDFGTRRRHSYAWQRLCLETLREGLGEGFRGTSNLLLAKELGLAALGTNGHEIPMVLAALAPDDAALRRAPYQALEEWARFYDDGLLIVLPDTFGTEAFLSGAPGWVADWRGFRPDSSPPIAAGERLIAWWRERGRDPAQKLLVFSDGLHLEDIETTHAHFAGRVGVTFGWGTNLTNDMAGCAEAPGLAPISLVCKVTQAAGRPAVKLSDNPEKATGDPAEIARYRRVFGQAGHLPQPVRV